MRSNATTYGRLLMDRFDVVAWVSGALFIFVLVMDYLELLE